MKTILLAAGCGLLIATLSPGPVSAQQRVTVPAQDRILTEKATTQFASGAEDGENWELLSSVRQVAFDANENLYVLDGGNYRVLMFSPSGKFIRQIGKQGSGPGELLLPVSMAVTTDGRV